MRLLVITLALFMLFMTGCGKKDDVKTATTPSPAPTATTTPTSGNETPDAVTTASIVDEEGAFLNAISKSGTWIICLTKDITTDKELLMEGEYKNGKKDDAGNDVIQRKLALYAQDENRNITARFTLTAPKLTVTSPKASIQKGTFKGDLYVSVSDFELVDATIDGNVYFTSEEAKNTFKMDETSKITGEQEMEEQN